MHKRTTPIIFKRAKELRREMTPQERKLHAHLRAHRMGGVHFRPHTCPPTPLRFGDYSGGRCQGHAIGNYIADFSPDGDASQCAPRRKLIIELDGPPFGRSILNKTNMTPNALHILNPRATASSVFGIMMS